MWFTHTFPFNYLNYLVFFGSCWLVFDIETTKYLLKCLLIDCRDHADIWTASDNQISAYQFHIRAAINFRWAKQRGRSYYVVWSELYFDLTYILCTSSCQLLIIIWRKSMLSHDNAILHARQLRSTHSLFYWQRLTEIWWWKNNHTYVLCDM